MRAEFDALTAPDYERASGWLPIADRADAPGDVFYLHPTAAHGPGWFGDPDDEATDAAASRIASAHVSAFPGTVWAPRYRHASSRAFRDIRGAGEPAYGLAYRDIERAFESFVRRTGDRPFLLAGHSQGARHVLSLLAARIAGSPVAERLVAAYAVGVGVAVNGFEERFPGLTLLGGPGEPGCVLSWNSYLDGADPSALLARTEGPIACVNPLTFDPREPIADSARHLASGARVGARTAGGVLLVTPEAPGGLDHAALPGGNLHRLDIELFSENVRADALLRLAAHGRRVTA